MSKAEINFKTETLILGTKNRLSDLELACGKLENPFSSGYLFYLIEIAGTKYSDILAILQKNLEDAGGAEDLNFESFELLLSDINQALCDYTASNKTDWLGQLNAVIGLVLGKELYFAQTGKITGFIFRRNKISSLAEKTAEDSHHPTKTFLDITSGELEGDDKIIFGNSDFESQVPLEKLRTIIKHQKPLQQFYLLGQSLRRNKIIGANAIIITTRADELPSKTKSIPTEPLPDVLFLDEPDDRLIKYYDGKIKPILLQILSYMVSAVGIGQKYLNLGFKKLLKHWHTTGKPFAADKFRSISQGFREKKRRISAKSQIKFQIESADIYFDSKSDTGTIQNANSLNQNSRALHDCLTFCTNILSYSRQNWRKLFRRQNIRLLYLFLFIFALAAGFFKIRENNLRRSEKVLQIRVETAYDKAIKQYSDFKTDYQLGKPINYQQAAEIIGLARQAATLPENKTKTDSLIRGMNEIVDTKTKTVRLYADLSASIGQSSSKIILVGSEIFGAEGSSIFSLDMREKEATTFASIPKESGQILDLIYLKSENQLVVYTDLKKVFGVDLDSKGLKELLISDDPAGFEEAIAIGSYSTNLYLLDQKGGLVWKHVLHEKSYAKGSKYTDSKKTDLRDSVDLTLDGNLYVLKKNAGVFKFKRGILESEIRPNNLPEPNTKIENATKIYTDDDASSLFILDSAGARVVRIDKFSGDFQSQYVLDNSGIDDFAVNTKLQKIWFLSEGRVVEGNL